MILPTKHIHEDNALIGVGTDILTSLDNPKTVSILFHETQSLREVSGKTRIHFDWFLLSLDFLYCIKAIKFENNLLRKNNS